MNLMIQQGWQCPCCNKVYSPTTQMCFYCPPKVTAASNSTPQRKPLTDEKIFDLAEPFGAFQYGDAQGHKRLEFARAIEAAHGIKGE